MEVSWIHSSAMEEFDKYNSELTRNRFLESFFMWRSWSKKLYPYIVLDIFKISARTLQLMSLSSCSLGYHLAAPGWVMWSACPLTLYLLLFLPLAPREYLSLAGSWRCRTHGIVLPKLDLDLSTINGVCSCHCGMCSWHVKIQIKTTILCVEYDHSYEKIVCVYIYMQKTFSKY